MNTICEISVVKVTESYSNWILGAGQFLDSLMKSRYLNTGPVQILKVFLFLQLFLSIASASTRSQVTNRFYETLGENEWQDRRMLLRTMVYDYANNFLFVGAVNRVYALSYETLENVSDSYKSSSDEKPEECINSETCDVELSDFMQLLVPHKDILVVCGTARRGQCVRLFSNPLKEQINPVGYNLVSVDRFSPSFGFFDSGFEARNNLIVATSYKNNNDEKVASTSSVASPAQFHFIEGWNTQGSKQTTYELLHDLKDQVTIDFKGGFSHNGVVYFFSNQTRKNFRGSFVTRMCSKAFDTFVEFRLTCKGDVITAKGTRELQEFDELVQVKFLPSDQSDGGDSTTNDGGTVFAAFTQSRNRKASVVCTYSLSDIENVVVNVVKETDNKKVYSSSYPSNWVEVNTSNIVNNKCMKLHHLSPISSSSSSLTSNGFVDLKLEAVTSLAVVKEDDVVAYVGTQSGKIFKLKINSTPQPMVEIPLGDQPYPIKDLLILTKDDLFALTKKEVLKIKTFDCDVITSCQQCIADIHCGWCMSTARCTDSPSSCRVSQHHLNDECVEHVVGPEVVSVAGVADFKVNISTLPPTHDKKSCLYEDVSDRSMRFETIPSLNRNSISCPFDGSRLKSTETRSVSPVSLSVIFDETTWTNSTVLLVNCSLASSCQECTNISCSWDNNLLQCTESKSSGTFGPGCPTIEPQTSSLVPAGSSKNISVIIRNLQSYGDVWCSFAGPVIVTPSARVSSTDKKLGTSNEITCSQVQLDYQEGIPIKNATLSLVTNVSKNSKTIITHQLQIYKCRHLAQNCGQCRSLDKSYGCRWCDNQCTFGEKCNDKPGTGFQQQEVCTDVAITSFHPSGGPRNGGTAITVNGRNFVFPSGNVEVFIGNSKCNDVKIENSERFVCNTSKDANKFDKKFPLTLKRKPSFSINSTQLFHYKDALITSIEPTKGLVSGGTQVTLTGQNFDYGNNFRVFFKQAGYHQQLPIINRTNRKLVFKTLPVSQKMPASFSFAVDNSDLPSFNHQFQFLENPSIESFEHPFTITHGGTPVIFKGKHFDHLDSVRLIVYLPDGSNRTGVPCNVTRESRMACPTPDISDVPNVNYGENNRSKLHFGLLGCTVQRWLSLSRPDANFTRTPFKALAYYKTPKIEDLPEVIKVKQDQTVPQYVDVRSSNNDLLKRFKDLSLIVCGVRVKSSVPNNPLRFEMPHYFDLKNGKGQDIEVKVGNYRKTFGRVSLVQATNLARFVGIIVGLVLGFLAVIIVSYFVYRCCKLKHKPKRKANGNADDVNVSLPNLREVSCRGDPKAINPYSQAVPGPADETVPLVRTTQDDENYFQNIIRAIEVLPEEGDNIYIARDNLQMGNLIGRGNFGSVYVATLVGPNETKTVAVKTIDDPDMKEAAVENFVKEGLMMKKFDHPNVMGLFGLCVGYRKEPMVVLPFMTNGDLRSYVKDTAKQFTARELLKLTHQVSMGMAYLSSINFIHRDLAARNCMIDEHEVVKVADFGLSHELHEKNYYSSRDQKAKLPIKWMALESLESFIFTIKSDVWSFGVLMWEVMTRGVTPYPDVGIFETRDYLASGRRLRKPKYCPENVYAIMMRCWSEIPDQRPTFTDLVNDIEIMLNPPRKTSSSNDINYLNQLELQEGVGDVDYLRPH